MSPSGRLPVEALRLPDALEAHLRAADCLSLERLPPDLARRCAGRAAEGGSGLLDLARLAAWQRSALAPPASDLRAADAFAKGGRERYGFRADLFADLDRRLRARSADPPLLAAVRAYLDVQFFHPFVDGNARAARRAFDFHAPVRLRPDAPIFRMPIPAGSERAYRAVLRMALALSGA